MTFHSSLQTSSKRPIPAVVRSRLRLAVVGSGAVTQRYHLPALVASPDVIIEAVVDPVLSRASEVAGRVGARAFASHRDLPGQVDVAIVATPNAWHAPLTIELLEAGIHVLVEKPMARTVAECDAMCAAADRGRAVLAVGHDFRYFPVARAARDLLASGILGGILRVDVRQSAGVRWPCFSESALTAESGGGVLLSFGVHTVDLLRWWLGEMTPTAFRDDSAGGVEAECECHLVLGNGAPVYLEVSRRRSLRDTTLVECERGVLEIGIFEPAVMRLTLTGASTLDASIADAEFERAPLQTVFSRQLADFVTAIRTQREPLVSGDAGRRAVAVVEQCYRIREPLRRPWDYPEAYASLATAEPA